MPHFDPAPPPALRALAHLRLRAWEGAQHGRWPALARCPVPSVRDHPERHTLLYAARPLVVTGGRFREAYMWDSLWIWQEHC
jgi:alpha,alpha-trehalase